MIWITEQWHKPKGYKTLRGARAYMQRLVGPAGTWGPLGPGRGITYSRTGHKVTWRGATGEELFD